MGLYTRSDRVEPPVEPPEQPSVAIEDRLAYIQHRLYHGRKVKTRFAQSARATKSQATVRREQVKPVAKALEYGRQIYRIVRRTSTSCVQKHSLQLSHGYPVGWPGKITPR